MPSCFVCGISRTPLTKRQNITFHRFPSKPKILEKWYEYIKTNGLDVGNITEHSLICSRHFHPFLLITNKSCRTLSKTAFPSIIVPRVKRPKLICSESNSIPILDDNESLVRISTSRMDIDTTNTSDDEWPKLVISMNGI